MKKSLLPTLLLLACAAFAGDALNEYKFVRSAKSGGTPAETLAIRFDNTLYKNTNADYSNILITDSDGNTVPFAVCDIVEYAGQSYSGKITDFKRDDKQNLAEIELTLPQELAINIIAFSTPLRRFDKKVSITFFDSENNIIRKDEKLKLYKYDDLYGTPEVKFKRITAKKLQIIIHNFTEATETPYFTETTGDKRSSVMKSVERKEFLIKNIVAKNAADAKRRMVPVVMPETRADVNGKTVITIDACRIPLETLKVSTNNKYYCRTVTLEHMDKKNKLLYAHAFQILNGQDKIPLKVCRADKLRLTIINGYDAPLKDLVLSWEAPEKILLAASRSGKDLKIYYGGNAPKKSYDIEKYAGKLLLAPHDFYSLGEEEISAAYAPGLPKEKIMNYAMWGVLAVVILLLGAVIVKLLMAPAPVGKE